MPSVQRVNADNPNAGMPYNPTTKQLSVLRQNSSPMAREFVRALNQYVDERLVGERSLRFPIWTRLAGGHSLGWDRATNDLFQDKTPLLAVSGSNGPLTRDYLTTAAQALGNNVKKVQEFVQQKYRDGEMSDATFRAATTILAGESYYARALNEIAAVFDKYPAVKSIELDGPRPKDMLVSGWSSSAYLDRLNHR